MTRAVSVASDNARFIVPPPLPDVASRRRRRFDRMGHPRGGWSRRPPSPRRPRTGRSRLRPPGRWWNRNSEPAPPPRTSAPPPARASRMSARARRGRGREGSARRRRTCRHATAASTNAKSSELLDFEAHSATFREPAGERSTRSNSKLPVDVREVCRDRVLAHEQRRGDLLVRASLRGELRDTTFRLGDALGRAPAADATELAARPLRPQTCAELLESRQSLLE